MGTATGDPERVAALHDGRLRMLWEKLVDTPVRGVVYEAAGPLPPDVLERGRAVARRGARDLAHPARAARGRSRPITSAGAAPRGLPSPGCSRP